MKYTDELPIFITGNKNKAEYLSRQLDISLLHRNIDLEEVQSTNLHTIVEHKLRQAYNICRQPVLVEDVSLTFNALANLPGPYIKWFVEIAGEEACCRMLDGFDDRSAEIHCTFGYFNGRQVKFFDNKTTGKISMRPKGDNGFGFDRIFIHDGMVITRAEMSQSENERTYAEDVKPFTKLEKFLLEETK